MPALGPAPGHYTSGARNAPRIPSPGAQPHRTVKDREVTGLGANGGTEALGCQSPENFPYGDGPRPSVGFQQGDETCAGEVGGCLSRGTTRGQPINQWRKPLPQRILLS